MKNGKNCALCVLAGVLYFGIWNSGFMQLANGTKGSLCYVYAEEQSIQYSYDALGRVVSAVYPDGTTIIYTYDKNGNMTFGGQKTEESSQQDTGGASTEANVSGVINATTENSISNKQNVSTAIHYTSKDIKKYNQFKKKKGKIKSLKVVKKKKKYYLKITVNKIFSVGEYGEKGYQVKYAANAKFKNAKTIKFNRSSKKSLTSKSWKVSKGKTYYVKVRAYMKTKTGKTLYTKYSTVKMIKVK